jgi:hypothetical protein
MTIKEALKLFKLYPPDTTILVLDEETSAPCPVTDLLYDEVTKSLELVTT